MAMVMRASYSSTAVGCPSSSSASCSPAVRDCPSSSASAHSSIGSSWADGLWLDIDLAERYLISSQFDKAAVLCSTVLRNMKDMWKPTWPSEGIYGGIEDNEVEDIIEAAGMVSIQAYSESGRPQMIFNDLETVFGCVAKVPSSVFLAGLCLQISAELYMDAQQSIDSFLKHWAFTSMEGQSCMFKSRSDECHRFLSLDPGKYIEIVEIYCIEVLAKGLGRVDQAINRVKEADIPAEIKQDIFEKLERFSLSRAKKDKSDLVTCHQKMTGSIEDSSACLNSSTLMPPFLECVEAESETKSSKLSAKQLDSHSSLKSVLLFSPVMDILTGWRTRSFVNFSDLVSTWNKVLAIVYQRKVPFGGAAAVFLMIAIYRSRLNLSSVLGSCGKLLRQISRAIFVSLLDFWQLAFNVQLNPLAAVQPLPSVR